MKNQISYKKYFIKFATIHFIIIAFLLAVFYLTKNSIPQAIVLFIDAPVFFVRLFVDAVLIEEIPWSIDIKNIVFYLFLGSLFWGAIGIIAASVRNIIRMIKSYRKGEGKKISRRSKISVITVWLSLFAICIPLFIFVPFAKNIISIGILNQTEITKFKVDGEKLFMNGEINSQTPRQLKKVLDENPQITTIVEQIVPGSSDDEKLFPMARMVRERGLNTHLESTSKIDSGGVDFFLSGKERTMERGAHIGVHSWGDGFKSAKDYPKDAPEHEMNRKYVEDMLGSDEFYWFTIYAAPVESIKEMTEEEILKYKLLTQPIIEVSAK